MNQYPELLYYPEYLKVFQRMNSTKKYLPATDKRVAESALEWRRILPQFKRYKMAKKHMKPSYNLRIITMLRH